MVPQRDLSADRHEALTLRLPWSAVAVLLAVVLHVASLSVLHLLPDPPRRSERIALSIVHPPPLPPPATPPVRPPPAARAPHKKRQPAQAPPMTSPVVPELPPSEVPPQNRAQLPVVEQASDPAPPPTPSFRDRLAQQLRTTTAPAAPQGVLAPSLSTLGQVANRDPRLHDDEAEQRLEQDFGVFFQRGIDALRRQWRPEDALLSADVNDPTKLCGRALRTTQAVAVIDRNGNVVDVDMRVPSGCVALDTEAVAAFLRVAQFPFPPSGLFVNSDGTASDTTRIPVRFIVSFDGRLQLDWN